MRPRPPNLPALYVEGVDDVSAVAALLKRHGIDTKQGQEYLWIAPRGSDTELLASMADTIKAERVTPCGFILDIDIEIKDRWQAVVSRLQFAGDPSTKLISPPDRDCPAAGYIGQVAGYPKEFGVWLMPDCKSAKQKLEHLIESLIPADDILFIQAKQCAKEAKDKVDAANAARQANAVELRCFGEIDRIKAEVRTWLAWQREPGMAFGAAINDKTLSHDSPQALALLAWMKRLYGFNYT